MESGKLPRIWVRSASALVAVAIVLGLGFFFQAKGFLLLVLAAVVLGTRELIPILFLSEDSLLLKSWFYLLCLGMFSLTTFYPASAALSFACISILFLSTSLLRRKRFENLELFSRFQIKSVLGLFYIGLLPSFAAQILQLPGGHLWFVAYLSVVLAGDTGAYLIGSRWGKRKLMPEISPNKTRLGLMGGLCSSSLVSSAFIFFIPNVPSLGLLALGTVCGLFGQMGDLFESSLKRVAQVKDTGSLMPGHGGILDRIDGLLFAAPFFWLGAKILLRIH
ncbi:MAG: phosphatidate cytidylyltransferase [Bdellovibrio sp.]